MLFSEIKQRITAVTAACVMLLSLSPVQTFAEAGAEEFGTEEIVVITEEPTETTEETDPEETQTASAKPSGLSRVTVVHSAEITTASAVSSTDAGTFAFTTYGWGHCVGLSQNGANFYAKYAGWSYQDILFHYYPGTTLKNTGTAESEIVTVQGVPGNVLQQVSEIVNVEIGPSFEPECIKAQAVAIYTYMKYHNNDAHDLKGRPNPSQKIVDLVASVLGEALYYQDKYCLTMFYASCGGLTANCYDIFNADLPYLRSVSSDYDEGYDPHWGDVKYYTIDEVRSRIQNAYNITLSSNPNNWIQLIEGNGGYVNSVVIDGQITVRGYPFSRAMGLKSPKFTYICSPGASPVSAPADPDENHA